jgi:hypothetical protein
MIQGTVFPDFKRSKSGIEKKSRDLFVPAYFVDPPNLDLFTALQNLVWYAVECLNSLPSISGRNKLLCEHFFKCVALLAAKEKECSSSLDRQALKLFTRFLEEAGKAETLLREHVEKAGSDSCPDIDLIPKSVAGDISAKATYLQWLAISIGGEFKIPFDSSAPDAAGQR